ncbi:hypothetical protein ACFQVA_15900 [Actinomadura keratinilytica]
MALPSAHPSPAPPEAPPHAHTPVLTQPGPAQAEAQADAAPWRAPTRERPRPRAAGGRTGWSRPTWTGRCCGRGTGSRPVRGPRWSWRAAPGPGTSW